MKRRNADCGKIRRPIKRNKIAEQIGRSVAAQGGSSGWWRQLVVVVGGMGQKKISVMATLPRAREGEKQRETHELWDVSLRGGRKEVLFGNGNDFPIYVSLKILTD